MISVAECVSSARLSAKETHLGVVQSERHGMLLASYLLNLDLGAAVVRDMIVADLRRSCDLGAPRRAADLLLVLRLFLTEHPEARRAADTPFRAAVCGYAKMAEANCWICPGGAFS